jgi:mannitol-1-/sugar-/sorbitol-6-phosphatase
MQPLVVLPCRALLFDCDGVLVDSDDTVRRSWGRWAQHYGLDPDSVTPLVHGRRSADTVRILIPAERRSEAVRTIDAYELEDALEVRSVRGASALVASLPPAAWAVVTSGRRALAEARLKAAGLPLPRVLITADDVTRGKPDAEGYLAAARNMEVPPDKAIVLEDSGSGVEAARRAGVAAIVGVGPKALDTDADVVVDDLTCLEWTGAGLSVGGVGVLRSAHASRAAGMDSAAG